MKKPETSKVLLGMTAFLSIVTLGFSLFWTAKMQTYETIYYIVPAVFTEFGAATGFYYNKAKHENKIKIVLGAINEISQSEEELTENEVRIIESLTNILND